MSDTAVAIWVACGLIATFGLAAIVQRRVPGSAGRGGVAPTLHVLAEGTPKGRIDVMDERLEAIEGRLATTDHHVANMRTMIGALPSGAAVHRLEVELTALKGDVKLGNAETLATARAVERIENHLLAVAAARTNP